MPIVIEDVSYTYMKGTPFQQQALNHVSLTIPDGAFVGVVGHTGSGKSTLMQMIGGLIPLETGRIVVNGVDLSAKKPDKMALRKTLGMIFQYPEHQLFEETVEKDIAYGPEKLGCSKEEVEQRVRQAMEWMELDYEGYRKKSPFDLSGGQKRKVAIAGVLAMQPSILIMDEPIAGLDPMGRESLMDLTRRLNQQGTTILMVSHNMDGLAEYATDILVMQNGEKKCFGSPEQVFADDQMLEETGLMLPETGLLIRNLRKKGIELDPGLVEYGRLKAALLQWLEERK